MLALLCDDPGEDRVNRRDTILSLIALGAAPLAFVAQQSRVPKLGILAVGELEPALGFFREGLRDLVRARPQKIRYILIKMVQLPDPSCLPRPRSHEKGIR